MKNKLYLTIVTFIFFLIMIGSYKAVSAANINTCQVEGAITQIYDGTAKKPKIKVKYNNRYLIENTDYSLSYSNNTNIGTASVTINGKGSFSGNITKKFKILKVEQMDESKEYYLLSSAMKTRAVGTANSSTNNEANILISTINRRCFTKI